MEIAALKKGSTMKPIAILILSMGMIGSPVLQAQETGQGAAVPRQGILVAQASPPPPPVVTEAPAAVSPTFIAVAVGLGLVVAGIAASNDDGTTTTTHH
jgi:hypothetical protein